MRWWGSRSAGPGSKPWSPALLPWVCSVEEAWLGLSLWWIDRVVKWSRCLTAICCFWTSYSSWLVRIRECLFLCERVNWLFWMLYILAMEAVVEITMVYSIPYLLFGKMFIYIYAFGRYFLFIWCLSLHVHLDYTFCYHYNTLHNSSVEHVPDAGSICFKALNV